MLVSAVDTFQKLPVCLQIKCVVLNLGATYFFSCVVCVVVNTDCSPPIQKIQKTEVGPVEHIILKLRYTTDNCLLILFI